MQIRVTGIVLKDNSILLVKQKIDDNRKWSLPGGRVESGETLSAALKRELLEETGLSVEIHHFLYLCEKPEDNLLHITFLCKNINGKIKLPTNEHDSNPISDVKFVKILKLQDYGFTERFQSIVENRFPKSGNYIGLKEEIGL